MGREISRKRGTIFQMLSLSLQGRSLSLIIKWLRWMSHTKSLPRKQIKQSQCSELQRKRWSFWRKKTKSCMNLGMKWRRRMIISERRLTHSTVHKSKRLHKWKLSSNSTPMLADQQRPAKNLSMKTRNYIENYRAWVLTLIRSESNTRNNLSTSSPLKTRSWMQIRIKTSVRRCSRIGLRRPMLRLRKWCMRRINSNRN